MNESNWLEAYALHIAETTTNTKQKYHKIKYTLLEDGITFIPHI